MLRHWLYYHTLISGVFGAMLLITHILHSNVFERGIQQEPVFQHAGFSSEVDSGQFENTPSCQQQSGLSTAAGVSVCMWPLLLPDTCLFSSKKLFCRSWLETNTSKLHSTYCMSLLSSSLQPCRSAGQRPADWLLPSLPRLLHPHHVTAGNKGHRGAGVGFHLPLLPLQVPVESHGEGHDQHLQVSQLMCLWKSNTRFKNYINYYTCSLQSAEMQVRLWLTLTLLCGTQLVQHTAGTQEGAHPQLCSWELLFFDEKGMSHKTWIPACDFCRMQLCLLCFLFFKVWLQ